MQGMHNHWAGQHRALTMQGVPQRILGRFRRLGVVVIYGIAFTSFSALADDDIVVPRDFPTIQAAVDAAAPGGTIKVRKGIYTEEVVIGKDLTLKGEGIDEATIKAPPTLTPFARRLNGEAVAAVVLITDAARVRMTGFTVSGPIPCGASIGGIFVVKEATLKLSHARITTIHPGVGCPIEQVRGVGIGLGLPHLVEIDGQLGTAGHAKITHVAIDRFQFFGIIVAGPTGGLPSTATISRNVITGGTPFPSAQVGIDVRLASVARVTENTVRGMVCTLPFCGRDPINELLSGGGLSATFAEVPGTVFKENTVVGNDVGIYLFGSEGCCETRENTLRNNRFFGIVIQDGSNDTKENEIRGGEVGIGVVADFVDTVAVLRDDEIKKTSVAPVQELSCCGFTATAIVEDD